jgi:hypothetical protein
MLPVGRGLLIVVVLACLVSLPVRADAEIIKLVTPNADGSFAGTFDNDNDVALISFVLQSSALVTVNMTSHLDLIGFDPLLTLFGRLADIETGDFEHEGNQYGLVLESNFGDIGVLDFNVPGFVEGGMLLAGNYLLAVTQYDNFFDRSADGDVGSFAHHQDPFFTCGGVLPGEPDGGCFVSFEGTPRSPEFAGTLTIESEDVPQPVPEPGSLTLLALGSAALLAGRGRRSRPGIKAVRRK